MSLESKIGIFVTAEHYAFSIGIMNKAKFFLEYVTSPFFKMLQTVYTDGIKLYQLYRSPTTKLWSGNQIMYSRWISIGTWKVAVSRLSATRALSSIDMNVIGSGPSKIQASIMSSINDFPIILSLFFYLRLLSERNSLTGTISHFLGKNHKYKVDRFILNPIFLSSACKSSIVFTERVSVRLRSSVTVEACTMLTFADRRSGCSLLILGWPVACQLHGLKIIAADSFSMQTFSMPSFIVCLRFFMPWLALFNRKLTKLNVSKQILVIAKLSGRKYFIVRGFVCDIIHPERK